jgi:hypothetical protein
VGVPDKPDVIDVMATESAVMVAASALSVLIEGVAELVMEITLGVIRLLVSVCVSVVPTAENDSNALFPEFLLTPVVADMARLAGISPNCAPNVSDGTSSKQNIFFITINQVRFLPLLLQ